MDLFARGSINQYFDIEITNTFFVVAFVSSYGIINQLTKYATQWELFTVFLPLVRNNV